MEEALSLVAGVGASISHVIETYRNMRQELEGARQTVAEMEAVLRESMVNNIVPSVNLDAIKQTLADMGETSRAVDADLGRRWMGLRVGRALVMLCSAFPYRGAKKYLRRLNDLNDDLKESIIFFRLAFDIDVAKTLHEISHLSCDESAFRETFKMDAQRRFWAKNFGKMSSVSPDALALALRTVNMDPYPVCNYVALGLRSGREVITVDAVAAAMGDSSPQEWMVSQTRGTAKTVEFAGHASEVHVIRSHGPYIATGSEDRTIKLFVDMVMVRTLVGHERSVLDLAFDGRGGLFSAGEDHLLILWNLVTLKRVFTHSTGAAYASTIATVSDGRVAYTVRGGQDIVVVGRDGAVHNILRPAVGLITALSSVGASDERSDTLSVSTIGGVVTFVDSWGEREQKEHQEEQQKQQQQQREGSQSPMQWWHGSHAGSSRSIHLPTALGMTSFVDEANGLAVGNGVLHVIRDGVASSHVLQSGGVCIAARAMSPQAIVAVIRWKDVINIANISAAGVSNHVLSRDAVPVVAHVTSSGGVIIGYDDGSTAVLMYEPGTGYTAMWSFIGCKDFTTYLPECASNDDHIAVSIAGTGEYVLVGPRKFRRSGAHPAHGVIPNTLSSSRVWCPGDNSVHSTDSLLENVVCHIWHESNSWIVGVKSESGNRVVTVSLSGGVDPVIDLGRAVPTAMYLYMETRLLVCLDGGREHRMYSLRAPHVCIWATSTFDALLTMLHPLKMLVRSEARYHIVSADDPDTGSVPLDIKESNVVDACAFDNGIFIVLHGDARIVAINGKSAQTTAQAPSEVTHLEPIDDTLFMAFGSCGRFFVYSALTLEMLHVYVTHGCSQIRCATRSHSAAVWNARGAIVRVRLADIADWVCRDRYAPTLLQPGSSRNSAERGGCLTLSMPVARSSTSSSSTTSNSRGRGRAEPSRLTDESEETEDPLSKKSRKLIRMNPADIVAATPVGARSHNIAAAAAAPALENHRSVPEVDEGRRRAARQPRLPSRAVSDLSLPLRLPWCDRKSIELHGAGE